MSIDGAKGTRDDQSSPAVVVPPLLPIFVEHKQQHPLARSQNRHRHVLIADAHPRLMSVA